MLSTKRAMMRSGRAEWVPFPFAMCPKSQSLSLLEHPTEQDPGQAAGRRVAALPSF